MARCYLHLWWYFLMQGNYTTWAKRGALDVKELMLKLWNCYVLSKRDDCQDFFISFHRSSWDHGSPFQAPVSPKGWLEIKQFCKKTTTKNQGEFTFAISKWIYFWRKKMFRSLEQRHLQSVATYLRTLPQVRKWSYVYLSTLYNDVTLILLMMKNNEKWRNGVGVDSKWRRNDSGAQLQMWTGCVAKERCSHSSIKKAKSGCSLRLQHSHRP